MKSYKDYKDKDGNAHQVWKSEVITHNLLELYVSLVEEYGRINDIEVPDASEDIHIYDFIEDEKFISWAFGTYGLKFDSDMFTVCFGSYPMR